MLTQNNTITYTGAVPDGSPHRRAYLEGLGEDIWAPLRKYWATPSFSLTTPEAQALLPSLSAAQLKYTNGMPGELQSRIAPETYAVDTAQLTREGAAEAQLSLFYDYRTNPQLYPQWQEYLCTSGVLVPALWGKNDVIFVKTGAEEFGRDVKDLVLILLNRGTLRWKIMLSTTPSRSTIFLSARILRDVSKGSVGCMIITSPVE
jgi:hypothetical protein